MAMIRAKANLNKAPWKLWLRLPEEDLYQCQAPPLF